MILNNIKLNSKSARTLNYKLIVIFVFLQIFLDSDLKWTKWKSM